MDSAAYSKEIEGSYNPPQMPISGWPLGWSLDHTFIYGMSIPLYGRAPPGATFLGWAGFGGIPAEPPTQQPVSQVSCHPNASLYHEPLVGEAVGDHPHPRNWNDVVRDNPWGEAILPLPEGMWVPTFEEEVVGNQEPVSERSPSPIDDGIIFIGEVSRIARPAELLHSFREVQRELSNTPLKKEAIVPLSDSSSSVSWSSLFGEVPLDEDHHSDAGEEEPKEEPLPPAVADVVEALHRDAQSSHGNRPHIPLSSMMGMDPSEASPWMANLLASMVPRKKALYYCSKCKMHGILTPTGRCRKDNGRACPKWDCRCNLCAHVEGQRAGARESARLRRYMVNKDRRLLWQDSPANQGIHNAYSFSSPYSIPIQSYP